MNPSRRILIVGGVAGGASAAARLRRLDEHAEIVLFERGEHISYANCGLPYYIGGEITEKAALSLQTPEAFRKRYRIDVRVGHEVVSIFTGSKTVLVRNVQTGETLSERYDKLILSPGAEPIRPVGFNSERIFTLRNIPDTFRIRDFIDATKPNTAVVVGGGYIGLERAENLQRLGIETTIVQRSDHVLPPLDFDMACDVHRHLESQGVRLLLNNEVRRVTEKDGTLNVSLKNGELTADMMILSVGVQPDSKLAKDAGLTVDERGCIVVSKNMQTSDPDVYAVGDAVAIVDFVTKRKGFIPLAGPANKQGRVAADHLCGIDSTYTGTQGSAILRVFDMTVATTGVNEQAAKAAGIDYEKSFTWSTSHAGYYPGATNLSIKILFEKPSGKILGAQIVGFDGVDKRCDVLATAIRGGMTVFDLAKLELCYAPPYSSAKDPVNMAGFAAENILTGKVGVFHWHDVDTLKKDDGNVFVDVRTKIEFDNGHIDGFVNIPLDDLRGRLGELDTSKRIFVTCQIGVRGYAAARILSQHGFDVRNLSGGYRLHHSIFGPKTPARSKSFPKPVSVTDSTNTETKTVKVDACGLQCPGPIMKLAAAVNGANSGDIVEISTTDPAFASDIEGFCRRTGNVLIETTSQRGTTVAKIRKGTISGATETPPTGSSETHGKNFIVFSGDLDKAIAAFIMANASAALGRKTSIFFTFWGLNILRKPDGGPVEKDFLGKMFGWMMPKGSTRLPLSKMNWGGLGATMIRMIMKRKNIASLEELIESAKSHGVELVACSMSMDVMGIKQEELIDGVKIGGAAAMLAHAEESDMSLFI